MGSDCFSLMNQALKLAEVFVGAPISCSCEFDVSFLLTADLNCVAYLDCFWIPTQNDLGKR